MTVPCSISGSISPRPIPIRRRCGSARWREAAGVRVRFRPFLLGPIFKAQGWDTSPFNLYPGQGPPHVARPGAAVRRACSCRSGGPIRFRRTACSRRASRWPGSTKPGARISAARSFAPNSPTAAGSTMPRPSATSWRDLRSTRGRARSGAIGCDQSAAAGADRGGAAARHFRRAELHDRRRRIVLGQRPAGARAALGDDRALVGTLERALRIEPHRQAGARHVAPWPRGSVYSPKWKIEAASTAVAWPSRMPSTR